MPEIWPDEPEDESEEAIGLAYWWPLIELNDIDWWPRFDVGLQNCPEEIP